MVTLDDDRRGEMTPFRARTLATNAVSLLALCSVACGLSVSGLERSDAAADGGADARPSQRGGKSKADAAMGA
jgi:hypothetical protein